MADEDNGFDINKIINSIIGGNGPALAGIGSAIAGYNTGNNYEQLGREAADRADPFGSRDFYRDRLRQSYDDPSAILNDPGHRISVQRGLDATGATNAAQGYLGSGRMLQELSKYASDSDATYLDAERKQLGNLAGAQFDPANAGRFLMEGGKLSLEAKNKALDAMMTGLTMKGTKSDGWQSAGQTAANTVVQGAQDLVRAITSGGAASKAAVDAAIEAGKRFVKLPDGSTADLWAVARGGYRSGEPDSMTYPTNDVTGRGQFDTGDNIDQGGGWNPSDGGEVGSGIDWSNPDAINWGTVNINNFTASDWSAFANWFGDGAA